MAPHTRTDATVDPADVAWVDLVRLGPWQVAHELVISLPWLAGSLYAAGAGNYVAALACSFMFFLTGLRQVHNAFHHALGLPRFGSHVVMFVLSILMLGSMHAVQVIHLRHHRHCLAEDDVEAMGARLTAWRALMLGPRYPWFLHSKALEFAAPGGRRWIVIELVANALWIGAVIFLLDSPVLVYHVVAMAAGQCMTAFFAVWTTHHGCDPAGPIARSIRSPLKALVTYNMFYHFEHHAFPAVPTCRLPELARRLDARYPQLRIAKVY